MGKTIRFNENSLITIKEKLNEIMVGTDSVSHNDVCENVGEEFAPVTKIGDEGSNPPLGGNHYGIEQESIDFDDNGMSINDDKILGKYNLKDLILSKTGNYVTLNKIVVKELGKGHGSKFMEELARVADKNGWILVLTPDTTFGGSSVSRLKNFYKRFGFVPNKGRNTDFNTRESMIRKPINESNENTFENWFGNSVLKNENGSPIKMYHGTDTTFKSFGKEHIGRHGSYEGYGFNFTPYYTRAMSYNSNTVIEAYLRAEHPMTSKTHKLTPAKIAKVIAEIDKGVPYTNTIVAAFESPGYRENYDAAYYRRALPVAARYIYNTSKDDETGDAGTYASICLCGNGDVYKVISAFEKLGYDSVIHYDDNGNMNTVIVFEPNQIKLVGNKTYSNDSELMGENIESEVSSSEVDLSSFKKRDTLPPGIWKDEETLDSRVRLKLLDIADDFWEFVNLSWVDTKGIIITGSICNFNWSEYSDIDLHLIVDFREIDEKTEFVRTYLDAKKNEWNNEHEGLKIMGYPVELYVQDIDEMPEAGGIYDLEENAWVRKPNPHSIKNIGLNKFNIKDKAAEIMTIIDEMYKAISNTDDSYEIDKVGEDASYLWKKVKELRKNSLGKNGENGAGNIVYKVLRRTGYLDKLFKLMSMVYDKSNSITEGVQYDSLRNNQVFRYRIIADMANDGYVFHGTGEDGNGVDWDTVDPSKIKGGSRGTYGYGIYFSDHAYKCEKYAGYSGGHFIIANIKDFNLINLRDKIDKEHNIFVDKQVEYHKLYDALDNARNSREYDIISSKIDEYKETVDKELLYEITRIIDKSDDTITYEYLNDNIPLLWYMEGDTRKRVSNLYLSLGVDGFVIDTEFVIFNFDKLNKSIVRNKEELILQYAQKAGLSESTKKYLKVLKEEVAMDGSSEGNPYEKRWKAEREALKNFVANYGKLMQSKEDDKGGKLYKVYFDETMSNLIGYNYCICVQWDEMTMKPKSTVYIRALDKFTPFIRRNLQFDTRGRDNVRGNYDDTQTY